MSDIPFTPAEAKRLHATGQAKRIHGRLNNGLLKAAVFGANDGIVTTFAVVAGVAGAGLSPSIILIMGLANMIADGLSMGMGDYLGERSERRHQKYQYRIEKWEIEKIPSEEKNELVEFFEKKGMSNQDSSQVVSIITKYPKVWIELGFIDEMGLVPEFDSAIWKTGAMTFVAFMGAGALPLIPYFLAFLGAPMDPELQFSLSIISTLGAMFFVGSLRTFITKGAWWRNGLEMLAIGTVASASAYLVGAMIESIVK